MRWRLRVARSCRPGTCQHLLKSNLRHEDAPADPDARDFATGDRLVGEGSGDTENDGRFFDGHRQAHGRLTRQERAVHEEPLFSSFSIATLGMRMRLPIRRHGISPRATAS